MSNKVEVSLTLTCDFLKGKEGIKCDTQKVYKGESEYAARDVAYKAGWKVKEYSGHSASVDWCPLHTLICPECKGKDPEPECGWEEYNEMCECCRPHIPPCPRCKGSKYIKIESEMCAICKGSGLDPVQDSALTRVCRVCNGSGVR